MKRLIPIILSASFVLCACGGKTEIEEITETKSEAKSELQNMTTEEKVAQMLMVRCDSTNMDNILELQPGGIVMFAIDFKDLSKKEVKNKIQDYKDACTITPIIAVDEEGGTVVRVSSNPQLCDEKYESPQYYYNSGGLEAIKTNTAEKSDLLYELGITMNLAPVVDVSTDPEDFIYDRSLGCDAMTTSLYASEVVTVMAEHNMASCLKHFPGYGSNTDTHTGIAIDERSIDSLRENDFLPFKAGIDAGADAVLVSHNIINDVDPSRPASISKPIHDILRTELSFSGIIMTDDMSMDAMNEYESPYIQAVNAGNDMIIVTDYEKAYSEILDAVNDGTISIETIDAAAGRIVEWKASSGII